MRILLMGCIPAFAAAVLAAQTIVESAILTGATSTAAGAKGKSIGGSIGNVFGKVNGTAAAAAGDKQPAAGSSRHSNPRTVPPAARVTAPEPPLPRPSESAFEGIEKGTPREELLAKAGKPSFSFAMTEEGRLEETLRYSTKEGSSAKVRLTDGRVSSIEWSQPK